MKLGFGKVRKAADIGGAELDEALTRELRPKLPRGKVMSQSVLLAADQAAAIVARAEERARQLIQAAEAQAAERKLRAEAEGRADGAASLAARSLALAAREAESAERELDRLVQVASILAERLLGEALSLAPERVVSMARQALAEARGARRVTIVAHPDDAAILERSLAELGLPKDLTRIVADARRARHNLRLETDIGTLDAELAPQLERLALKLRETLGHG